MFDTSYTETEIKKIVESLPLFEVEHMYRIEALVEILTALVCKPNQNMDLYNCFAKAAFYHDIGKAWVSSKLLLKPGPLSDQEYAAVKQHPVYAHAFLKSHPHFFNETAFFRHTVYNAAVFHHEYWDGSGYPYAIQKEQIPLVARIVSVCDAYDAMTHARPYSAARSHKAACAEIEKWAGKQFDPNIASVFIGNEKQFTAIHDSYGSAINNKQGGIST
ncbi:MAG TPA: HD domain-containing phosphohydrolase [Clostridia bacterium]|nr:HD domain-containing phosphohydrolase [Clostridia bacterium]